MANPCITALRGMGFSHKAAAEAVNKASKALRETGDTKLLRAFMRKYVSDMRADAALLKRKAGARRGTVLSMNQIGSMSRADLLAWIDEQGGVDRLRRLAADIKERASNGEPVFDALRNTGRKVEADWFDKTFTYFINNILSGITTQGLNLTSGFVKAMIKPPILAAGRAVTGDLAGAGRAFGLYAAMWDSLGVAFKAAKTNWATGAKTFGLDAQKFSGISPDQLGAVQKKFFIPLRFLGASDEFMQVINGRAAAWDHTATEAMEMASRLRKSGMPESKVEQATIKWQNQEIKRWFDDPERFSAGAREYAATRAAQEGTFTQPLEPGFMKELVGFLSKPESRYLRIFIPFVQIPTTILAEATQYIPALPILKRYWTNGTLQALYGSADDVPLLIGRQMAGGLVIAGVGTLWSQGMITGNGPRKGTAEYEAWRRTHQPMSIKVGDSWVSYRAVEPLATVFALLSDTFDAMSKYNSDEDLAALGGNMALAVANAFTEKSFMKQASELSAVLQGETWRLKFITSNLATGAIPYSSLIRQVSGWVHPTAYQRREWLDGFRGMSFGVFPPGLSRYNLDGSVATLGDEFATSDHVSIELHRLRGAVSVNPSEVLQGIDLSPDQQDTFTSLLTRERLSGRTLHEQMARTISSRAYQRLSMADLKAIPRDGLQDLPQVLMLKSVVNRYKKNALRKLLKGEEPLKAAIKQVKEAKRTIRRSRSSEDVSEGAAFLREAQDLNQ